jgi:putative inorganic carbon (hco3(-)) transporter
MNPRLALWLLTFLILVVLSFRSRSWSVILYLMCCLIAPHRWWWGTSITRLPLMDSAVAIMALAVILHRRRDVDSLGPVDPVMFSLSLLTILNVTAVTCFALSFDLSLLLAIHKIKLLLVFNLMVAGVRSEADLKRIMLSLVIMLAILSFEGHITYTRGGRLEQLAVSGARGSNQIGSFWASMIPLFLPTLLQHRWTLRLGLIASIPFVLNLVLKTGSRSSILGLAGAYVTLFVLSRPRTRKYVALGGGLGASILLYLLKDPELIARYLGITTAVEVDSSASDRLVFWKCGLQAIQDYPLGLGGDCWDKILSPAYLAAAGLSATGRAVHQGFINEALDWGVQGLLLLLGLQLTSLWRSYRGMTRYLQLGDNLAAVRCGCYAAGIVSLMITGMFGCYLNYENSYLLFMLTSVDYRLATARLVAEAQSVPRMNPNPLPTEWRPMPAAVANVS